MSEVRLGFFEAFLLKRQARKDACKPYVFQDYKSGDGYPKRFFTKRELRKLKKRNNVPAAVFPAGKEPEIYFSFMEDEFFGYIDYRGKTLHSGLVWVRLGGLPRLMRFSKAESSLEAVYKRGFHNIASIDNEINESQKQLEAERDARIKDEDPKADQSHIKALYENRIAMQNGQRQQLMEKERRKMSAAVSEELALCNVMKRRLNSEHAHMLRRISYYYECAQGRQPLLPAKMINIEDCAKKYGADPLGDFKSTIQELDKRMTSFNAAKAGTDTGTEAGTDGGNKV